MLAWWFSNVKMVEKVLFATIESLELILDFQIMMLQNELIVESQPACGSRLCTLAQFSEAYRYLAQVDFDEECRV